MGERQSDGSLPGRRRVHPGGAVPGHGWAVDPDGPLSGHRSPIGPEGVGGPRRVLDRAELEALLAASLIGDAIDAEAEQRAVAAFRAARDAGAHRARARTRRRDDWRSREQRRVRRPVKITLSVLIASLTLGGVAVAAIGAARSSTENTDERVPHPQTSTGAPDESAGQPSATSSGSTSTRPDQPAPAQDTEAQCRAYEQVKERGKAMDATAWKRLVTAAGGERNVTDYCAEQLARATAEARPGRTAKPERSSVADTGGSANSSDTGSSAATNGADNADNADNATSGSGNADSAGSATSGSGNAGSGAVGDQGKPAQPNGTNR